MNLSGYYELIFLVMMFNYLHFIIIGAFTFLELREIIIGCLNPIKYIFYNWKILMGFLMVLTYILSFFSNGSISASFQN